MGQALAFPGGQYVARAATAGQLRENAFEWLAKLQQHKDAAQAALHDGDVLGAMRELRRAEHTSELARLVLIESENADPGLR